MFHRTKKSTILFPWLQERSIIQLNIPHYNFSVTFICQPRVENVQCNSDGVWAELEQVIVSQLTALQSDFIQLSLCDCNFTPDCSAEMHHILL